MRRNRLLILAAAVITVVLLLSLLDVFGAFVASREMGSTHRISRREFYAHVGAEVSEKLLAGTRVSERAGAGEVALVVSHSAGVGGWCLAELSNSKESEGGDCQANDSSIEGPFQGPIVAEAGNPLAFWKGGSLWVKRVVVLTTAQVAAVSYQGYKPIGTTRVSCCRIICAAHSSNCAVARPNHLPRHTFLRAI